MDLNDLKKMAGDMATQLAEKIKNDPELLKKFKDDPVATLKSMSGVDLPDESLKALAASVQAKLGGTSATSAAGDIASKLGKLF